MTLGGNVFTPTFHLSSKADQFNVETQDANYQQPPSNSENEGGTVRTQAAFVNKLYK